mgnify:CR=1 FL=1
MNATVSRGAALRQRFRILPFQNLRTGSQSWRVYGIKRDGTMIRENYQDPELARLRHIELESGYHANDATEKPGLRATRLTDDAIRIAETALARLDRAEDLLVAVDHWIRHGRKERIAESPRLDDAVRQFTAWLETAKHMKEPTRKNLRLRVACFSNSVPNLRVSEFTRDTVFPYLKSREVDPASRDNDRRALNRFFAWCMFRDRQWTRVNPCALARNEKKEYEWLCSTENAPPAILSLDECRRLMDSATRHRRGRLVPYVTLCLFGGLRPDEAARIPWAQINLDDGEIRIEAHQTKVKAPRVVKMNATLKAWLLAYRNRPIVPRNFRRDFDAVKLAAGFGSKKTEDRVNRGTWNQKKRSWIKPPKPVELNEWVEDIMRHTAISHHWRNCGSYGTTAEQHGTSESVIKKHYQGRVSSEDTKRFYKIMPSRKGASNAAR